MRRNPLSPTPPVPAGKKLHRLGTATEEKLRTLFGDLGDEFEELHRGVFLSPFPIVAYAYAAARIETGENDFGFNDVVDPPCLIGVALQEPEYIDTDAVSVAKDLLYVASKYELEEEPEDYDVVSDYCRSPFLDLSEPSSIYTVGGDIGNRPDAVAFYRAALDLQEFWRQHISDDEDPSDIYEAPRVVREKALQLSASIVPQSRILSELPPEQVVQICVIHPMTWNEEMGDALVDPMDSVEDGEPLTEAIPSLNRFLLQNSHDVYRAPSREKPTRWHGTSLSIARKAYPELISPAAYHEGLRAGSTYSPYAWQEWEDFEDEEEDDD